MIKTRQDLLKIVDHYTDAGDFDSAISFIESYPMDDVNIKDEIEKIEGLRYSYPITEKAETEPEDEVKAETEPIVENTEPIKVEPEKEEIKDDN